MYLPNRTETVQQNLTMDLAVANGLILTELRLAQVALCRAIKISAKDGTSKHMK
jgi:hypothetical protein